MRISFYRDFTSHIVHMDEKGRSTEDVMDHIMEFFEKDVQFSSGRIFGSMCTSPLPIARKVNDLFHESNLGNPGLYPGTFEMEQHLVRELGEMLHLKNAKGHVLSGGTEANITAIFRAKKITGGKKVLFPRSAHFSVMKAVKLMDLDPVIVDTDERFRMSVQGMDDLLGDDVACIFCIAGSTEFGAIDPIDRISKMSGDIPVHVDAAFGGYVIPFLSELGMAPDDLPPWDFENDGVNTLSLDPHKMGGSTIPAGCLIFRKDFPMDQLNVNSPYLTSSEAYTLAGTRDSGALAGAYAAMLELGREGYREMVRSCMENTRYLIRSVKEIGLEPVIDPVMNIATFHHDEPRKVQLAMQSEGFYISRIEDPPSLRFVVMPHVTKDAIDRMVPVLDKVIR